MSSKKDREFGRRIARLRQGYRLTQKEAANQIGVSYSAYQRYESGGLPSKRNLDRLISFYGCNEAWLILGEGETYSKRKWDSNAQIERLKEVLNIDSDEELASLLGVYNKSIDYIRKSNEHIPNSWYIKISKATHIPFDKIAFGVGPTHCNDFETTLNESRLDTEELVSSIDILPIDEEWVEKIVVRLEKRLLEMNRSLLPTWKAFVISSSYESFWYNNKTVDLKVVDACLRLALKGEKEVIKE